MICSLVANSTPITAIQTTLMDFSSDPLSFDKMLQKRLEEKEDHPCPSKIRDEFVLRPGKIIQLKDPVCKRHKIRLTKNGKNKRKVYTAKGQRLTNLKIQRYRCKKCGEYKLDFGEFIPEYDNYQREVKKQARHYYHLGNCPHDIRRLFKINGLTVPCETSIRNWVDAASETIEQVIMETTLPVSGYFGFDEIHIRTNRRRAYVFSLVDSWDGFYINAQFSPNREKGSIMDFLACSKRKGKTKFRGMTMDGSHNYGGIFKSRRFSYIKVGRCEMHFKGTLNERIYQMAGLGRKFKHHLPEPFSSLKEGLFQIFDSVNYTEALFQLARVEGKFYKKFNHKIDKLINHTYKLLPNLLRHLTDTRLKNTNNATERMNKNLLRHPSLKHQMRSPKGVNRIVKGKVFLHNFWAFQNYIHRISEYIRENTHLIALNLDNDEIIRENRSLKLHLSWVKKYYSSYWNVYVQYFKLRHEQFNVE
jgi:transposase-like protein